MPEKVVVVGAGFAGVNVAQGLQQERDVVLVAPSDRFVYLPMIHEVLSETAQPRDVALPLEEIVPEARHVHARGQRVEGHQLVLQDGERVEFDQLVVAVGAQVADFGIPGVAEHALPVYSVGDAMRANAELKHAATQLEGPLQVTVVGASFTGVEVAGEVAELLDKLDVEREVRLIEAQEQIFPDRSEAFRDGVLEGLKRAGIELVTSAPVEEVQAEAVRAEVAGKPRSWPTDVAFWCAGVQPRSIEGVDMRVESTLRSRGREDVYVAGDAASFGDEMDVPKLAQTAEDQADVVVHNILNPERPVAYEPNVRGLLVSIGAKYAVADLAHGPVFTGRIPWHVKRNLYKVKMSLT